MDDRIIKIAEYFEVTNQELKIQEEASELITELSRLQQKVMLIAMDKEYKDETEINNMMKNVIYELADVNILTNEIIYLYNAEEEFRQAIDYKLDRTIRRIENGYYK